MRIRLANPPRLLILLRGLLLSEMTAVNAEGPEALIPGVHTYLPQYLLQITAWKTYTCPGYDFRTSIVKRLGTSVS